MVVECIAIIVLVLVMSAMIFRSGKPGQAIAVLPLVTVPVLHLIGIPASIFLNRCFQGFSFNLFHISFNLVGLMVACVLYGMLAGNMGSRRGRKTYVVVCGIFSVLLSIVLVSNILK